MSYAHADCARQILGLLPHAGAKLTRSELNDKVKYVGKNETNFGGTLADLVQGGILDENKIPMRPTQYIRTAKQMPAPKAAGAQRVELPSRRVGKSEALRQEIAAADPASKIWPLRRPGAAGRRSNPETAERRDRIMEMLRAAKFVEFNMEAVRDLGLHKHVKPSQMYLDMDALEQQGRVAVIPRSSPKTWKIVTTGAPAAEAPAAVPAARAPVSPAAPGRAADLADWQNMDAYLADANNRARDCKAAYIHSVTDATVLRQMDAAIDSTEAALRIHRQRKPA